MRILVIGDSCIDAFNYGVCERLCPEGPVPIFTPKKEVYNPGMAANVESNLKGLGCETSLLTHENPPTKLRIVDTRHNHLIVRVDEPTPKIAGLTIDEVKHELKTCEYDAIVISDYDKGFLDHDTIEEILELHPMVFLDTKKPVSSYFIKENVWIKINEIEFKNTIDHGYDPGRWPRIIVTLGDKGCRYRGKIYPAVKQDTVRDVCGAGDTFLAALVVGYLTHDDMVTAIKFANFCSAWAVEQPGVATITTEVAMELGL